MNDEQGADCGRKPFLFLVNSLAAGGSEKKVVGLVNALHRRGWPVHLAYLDAPRSLAAECDPNVPLLFLGRKAWLGLPPMRRLMEYRKRHDIGFVHCVDAYPTLIGSLVAPHLPGGGRAFSTLIDAMEPTRRAEQSRLLLLQPALKKAQRVTFGCRAQLERWVRRYGLDRDKCRYVHAGVEGDRYVPGPSAAATSELRRELGWGEREVVVGTVGPLSSKKGYVDFMLACSRLLLEGSVNRVLIVSDGAEKAWLTELARELRMRKKMQFMHRMPDLRPAFAVMDMFVLPAAAEAFPYAALEAMAAGRPVILAGEGGATELAGRGASGLTYPTGDIETLVKRMRRVAVDSGYRHGLGAAARQRAHERFTFERMVDAYVEALFGDTSVRPMGLRPTARSGTVAGRASRVR